MSRGTFARIGAPEGTGSRVSGSAYLFDMQVARFFATLPASESETATEAPAATVAAEGTGA